MVIFLKLMRLGTCTGIPFVDSTPIRVCDNKQIFNHKVFNGIATRGKSTVGYFFSFKLHVIVNETGDILNFVITQGNVDDRTPVKEDNLLKNVFGKLFADRGYISQELFEQLFVKDIQLVTRIKGNIKNRLMSIIVIL